MKQLENIIRVRDVMKTDMDIRYCTRLLDRFGLSRAPVLEQHKVIGLLSITDIVLKGLMPEID